MTIFLGPTIPGWLSQIFWGIGEVIAIGVVAPVLGALIAVGLFQALRRLG